MVSRGMVFPCAWGGGARTAGGGVIAGGAARVNGDTTDLEQFLALVERQTPALLKVTASLVGYADAEDAAQEAVLKAWRARAGLRDVEKLRPWLLQIAVNVCREWQRGRFGQHQRMQLALLDGPRESLAAAREGDPGASERTEGLDLRQAIAALDDELRLVVVLRYYGGMDSPEIGAALGVPAATVRTRLRRALGLLRERLRDTGPLPVVERGEGGGHA